MIAQRLREYRLARGMSLDALAASIGGIVTKQALSKYEKGRSRPSPLVLNKLASVFGIKAAFFWSPPSMEVRFVAFRKGSRLPKKEQTRVEGLVRLALEDRVRLQELAPDQNRLDLPVQSLRIRSVDEAEGAAENLRRSWNLGIDPIACMTGVLEDRRIHVLEIESGEKFDGMSAAAINEKGKTVAAAVVTRSGVPGERQRLNLAHELGHLVLGIPGTIDAEKAAFRFGGAFLAPAREVYREVGTKRAFIRIEELLLLKLRFGMSLQALLYRFRDLGIIAETYYRQFCMDINRLGWRTSEPHPLERERPQWLTRTSLRAFAEGLISREEAERMTGERIETKSSHSSVERRAFMNLPLQERRRILEVQAERFLAHYEEGKEWKELQGGDIVDY